MSMSSTEKRRARAVVLSATSVLGAGVLGATIAPTASAAAGPSPCRTADLSEQLKPGSPGAGQRYATVVLTNTSGHTCTVTGYGGLALLGAPGQGVPTDLRRAPAPAPVTVPLAPGRSARSLLHWTVIPGANEPGAVCEHTAVTVVVTPPGRTTAALRPWTFGPVCQHGRIDQNAYVAGSGAF